MNQKLPSVHDTQLYGSPLGFASLKNHPCSIRALPWQIQGTAGMLASSGKTRAGLVVLCVLDGGVKDEGTAGASGKKAPLNRHCVKEEECSDNWREAAGKTPAPRHLLTREVGMLRPEPAEHTVPVTGWHLTRTGWSAL